MIKVTCMKLWPALGAILFLAACGGGGGGGTGSAGNTSNNVAQGGGALPSNALRDSALDFKEPDTFANGRILKTNFGSIDVQGGVASQFVPLLDCDGPGPKSASGFVTIQWENLATGQHGDTTASASCYHTGTIFGTGVRSFWGIFGVHLDLGMNTIHFKTFRDGRHVGDDEITIRRVDGIAPSVTYHYPAADETQVPLGRPVIVRFSEPMVQADLTADKLVVTNADGIEISGTHIYQANQHTWMFTPHANLAASSTFTVTLSQDIEDAGGGGILPAAVSWSFTTGTVEDSETPNVTGQWPGANGCNCAPTDTRIVLGFDEPLEPANVSTDNFYLEDSDGLRISARAVYHGSNLALELDQPLARNTRYRVTANTNITDSLGRPLQQPFVWAFMTGAADTQGDWRQLAPLPESLRGAAGVAADNQYFVWGEAEIPDPEACLPEDAACTSPLTKAGKGWWYNPALDQWHPADYEQALSPSPRHHPTLTWTGEHIVLFGGNNDAGPVSDGARYDPLLDSWDDTSQSWWDSARGAYRYLQGLSAHSAVWTGSEVIWWGGAWDRSDTGPVNRGWRYDPGLDVLRIMGPLPSVDERYTLLADPGAPTPRSSHKAIWTGTDMLVMGGVDANGKPITDGGRYNPVQDSWTLLEGDTLPASASGVSQLVWTGNEAIVWHPAGAAVPVGQLPKPTLRIYDPQAGTWHASQAGWEPNLLADEHLPIQARWTGEFMVVVGVSRKLPTFIGPQRLQIAAYVYDPVGDKWYQGAQIEISRGDSMTATWLDDQLVLFLGKALLSFRPS